ncbi:GDSL-type esterase/lipase family protein [Sphaerisporangium sp. NPDC088356]|uniref:SGNH/GDSL hydrolase family protein n=1 Tax=Sphaerisporangium sp. NPDC088356 TaxID=3154871 RepID=UPI003417C0D0
MYKAHKLALFSRHVLISMLSIVVAIAMVVCLAPATPARAAARDVTITLNASDLGVNPAVLRDIVPEMQAEIREHGGLGDTLKQAVADSQSQVSTTVDTSVWPNFSGTVDVTSNGAGLVLTIPAGEITTSGFWQQIAATAIAWIVGYGLRMLCIASLVSSGVGATIVPLVCTPLQATISGIMAALVTHAFAGDLGSPEATRDIIIAGILGLAGGFIWEKYLAPWAKANLAEAIKKAGIWIRSQVPWLDSWFGGVVATRVEQLGLQFQELEDLIAEETAAWAGVTSNLQRNLRIMALGDSITYGAGSSTGGGYRSTLNDLLGEDGATVTFVGSQHSGPAPDAHEGRSGWTISQIAAITDSAMATYRPNVVLLHIGTNDMNSNIDPDGAPARLGGLIDQIFRADPNVTLLVSTIVPSNWWATQARILRFNEAIQLETGARWAAGKHVYMVNMSAVTLTDLADLLHPNDSGYLKMAGAFYGGLVKVAQAGWIAASGGGTSAAGPVKGWFPQGTIASGTFGGATSRVIYADINGDGKADYVKVNGDSSVQAWLNGGPKPGGGDWYWVPQGTIAGGVGAQGSRVLFAPLYGTRSADYVLMGDPNQTLPDPQGNNPPDPQGNDQGDNPPDPQGNNPPDPQGNLVKYDSSVQVWQNGGPKAGGGDWHWIPGGQVASGVGVDGTRIQFADLNGDGRADYLDVDPQTGSTRAWINSG